MINTFILLSMLNIVYVIELLITLAIFVFALIAGISYLVNKHRIKKEAKKLRSMAAGFRHPVSEELQACKAVYGKAAKDLKDSEDVILMKGPVTVSTITSRYGTNNYYYLGPVELLWTPGLAQAIREENLAEIILLSSGKGLVLKLNEDFSIIKEAAAKQNIGDNTDYSESLASEDSKIRKLSRPLTDNEINYLKPELRLHTTALLLLACIIPLFSTESFFLILSIWIACAALYFLFKTRTPKEPENMPLLGLHGTLTRNSTPSGSCLMVDRFILQLPLHWIDRVPVGADVYVEGCIVKKNSHVFKVLELNEQFSIDQEKSRAGGKSYLPFLFAVSALVLMLFIHGVEHQPFKELHRYWMYSLQKNKQKNFTNITDLRKADLKPGREIQISDMRLLPDNSFSWMLEQNTSLMLDLAPLKKRIQQLEALQKTDLALQLYLASELEYADYLLHYIQLEGKATSDTMADYAQFFTDNTIMTGLQELERQLIAAEKPADTLQRELLSTYTRFMKQELIIMNQQLLDHVEYVMQKTDAIAVSFDNGGPEIPEPLFSYLSLDDLSPFIINKRKAASFKPARQDIGVQTPKAIKKLDELERHYASGPAFETVQGIVNDYRPLYDGRFLLRLDAGTNYKNVEDEFPRIIVFCIILMLSISCGIQAIRLYRLQYNATWQQGKATRQ